MYDCKDNVGQYQHLVIKLSIYFDILMQDFEAITDINLKCQHKFHDLMDKFPNVVDQGSFTT